VDYHADSVLTHTRFGHDVCTVNIRVGFIEKFRLVPSSRHLERERHGTVDCTADRLVLLQISLSKFKG